MPSFFGLADHLITQCFRQDKSEDSVKLPFKWMALESMQKGEVSEKTNVVCTPE